MEAGPYDLAADILKTKIKQMLSHCKVKDQSLERLPLSFIQFLEGRGVNKLELTIAIPRYVRVKPQLKISTEEVAANLKITMEEIVQVEDHFWAINPSATINHCSLYQEGLLYGMDYSSSIPVKCLQIQPEDTVLELCCAPGNKSMLIADLNKGVKITGVEISPNRTNIMKNLVKKYHLDEQISIVTADGVKFYSQKQFDRVLIDAECTHEGSLKHIFKFFKEQNIHLKGDLKIDKKLSKQQEKQFKRNNSNPYTATINSSNKWTESDFEERFLDPIKLSQLNKLQCQLLENGFSLLREGGVVVYSTCSFDQKQNQDIIADFAAKHQNAEILDAGKDLKTSIAWREGSCKGTIRLSPSVSCCGGMFVAKLNKRKENV